METQKRLGGEKAGLFRCRRRQGCWQPVEPGEGPLMNSPQHLPQEPALQSLGFGILAS